MAAAIFDLDRTLIAGASGTVFSAAMKASGFAKRALPGEKLIFGMFNVFGENLPSMALTRQAARLAAGRPRALLQRAGSAAVTDLLAMIQPYAWPLFDAHRAAGRALVLATTTPYDLVAPLAEALGFDAVIATRYGVAADGTFDGTLDGPFVWSTGKLAAVRRWAGDNDVDLRQSYAYSDSFFDSPLLGSVGHPVVVNPDPSMLVMATLRRWPVTNLDVPDGVAKLPVVGVELQRLVQQLAHPKLVPFADFDIQGVEHLPARGPLIVVSNHRSYFDPLALGITLGRRGRPVRFLGKKEIFDTPIIGRLATAMGAIRVDRGSGSHAPLEAAAAALAAGEAIAIMPQGTIPRGAAFFAPVLEGRDGVARLARKVPAAAVVPIGLWGTERVWPRASRLPRVLNVTDPPKVQIRVGHPVQLRRRSLARDTAAIMDAIASLLPADARGLRTPSAADLAATYPPGWRGGPT